MSAPRSRGSRPVRLVLVLEQIAGVPRIQWPAVEADVAPIADRLDVVLGRHMAVLTERLSLAEPELVEVAAVRLDVIADRRRRDDAALHAELAQRVLLQLMLANTMPARAIVEMIQLLGRRLVVH
jgi:hypothetical protein